jgi:hypothetical protein
VNCQFCNAKKATHRCPSCGTCLCDKHVEHRVGAKIFGSIFFMIPGIFVGVFSAELLKLSQQWAPLAISALFAVGLAHYYNGEGCMKCHKTVKKL